jgi:hypothetical protein
MIDLTEMPVVDNHVHPWRASTRRLTVAELAGHVFLGHRADERAPAILARGRARTLLDQLRATNLGAGYLRCELARFLNVDDDWTTVTAARIAAAEADYHAWTAHLFDEAKHRGAAGRRRRCAAAYRAQRARRVHPAGVDAHQPRDRTPAAAARTQSKPMVSQAILSQAILSQAMLSQAMLSQLV